MLAKCQVGFIRLFNHAPISEKIVLRLCGGEMEIFVLFFLYLCKNGIIFRHFLRVITSEGMAKRFSSFVKTVSLELNRIALLCVQFIQGWQFYFVPH